MLSGDQEHMYGAVICRECVYYRMYSVVYNVHAKCQVLNKFIELIQSRNTSSLIKLSSF